MRGHLRARFAAFLVTLAVLFGGSVAAAASASAVTTAGYCYTTYLVGSDYSACQRAASYANFAPQTGRAIVNEVNIYCYQKSLYGYVKAWNNARARIGAAKGDAIFYAAHFKC